MWASRGGKITDRQIVRAALAWLKNATGDDWPDPSNHRRPAYSDDENDWILVKDGDQYVRRRFVDDFDDEGAIRGPPTVDRKRDRGVQGTLSLVLPSIGA